MRENVTVGGTKYKKIQIVVHKIVDKRETAAIWYYNTFLKAGNYDLHKRTKKFKHLSLVLTETEKKTSLIFGVDTGWFLVFCQNIVSRRAIRPPFYCVLEKEDFPLTPIQRLVKRLVESTAL